jgi:hypothetical protein
MDITEKVSKAFNGSIIKGGEVMENGEKAGISLRAGGFLAWYKAPRDIDDHDIERYLKAGKQVLENVLAGVQQQADYEKRECSCLSDPSKLQAQNMMSKAGKPYIMYKCPDCNKGYLKQRDGSYKLMGSK